MGEGNGSEVKIVIFGLSITSSWGNGHATTFRALARALHARGHRVVFFEKDVEWYASNRDLPEPDSAQLNLYTRWTDVLPLVRRELASADVAMVGSYFPDGIAAMDAMLDSKASVRTFYDIDTPITVASLREAGATEYLRADQLPELDVYFSFTGGPMLGELESRFGVRRAAPLYCSFDPERYRTYPRSLRFACAMSYMGTYAPDRQPKLEEFLFGAAQRAAAGAVHRGRAAVSTQRSPAAQCAPHRASESALASALVLVFALDPQRDPSRYGDGRLLAVGASV